MLSHEPQIKEAESEKNWALRHKEAHERRMLWLCFVLSLAIMVIAAIIGYYVANTPAIALQTTYLNATWRISVQNLNTTTLFISQANLSETLLIGHNVLAGSGFTPPIIIKYWTAANYAVMFGMWFCISLFGTLGIASLYDWLTYENNEPKPKEE